MNSVSLFTGVSFLLYILVPPNGKLRFFENEKIERRERERENLHVITYWCRLGSIFAELANTYYRDEGRKIKTRIEKKSFSSIELSVRYCFKVRGL